MADTDARKSPFSNGTEFMDWRDSNCAQCVAEDACPLAQAVDLAYIGDGKMARHAVALIGCDGMWPKPCTLRHHKKDDSKTRKAVLSAIDAALAPLPTPARGGTE